MIKNHTKESVKGICSCCGNSFPKMIIHHLNGNPTDDIKDNLIVLCSRCHNLVHRGFCKRRKDVDSKTKEKILFIRKILLLKFNRYSMKDAEDRIRYERAIYSNHGKRRRCAVCSSLDGLKLYAPNFILKFDRENSKGIGIIICNKCSKNKKNLKNLNLISE